MTCWNSSLVTYCNSELHKFCHNVLSVNVKLFPRLDSISLFIQAFISCLRGVVSSTFNGSGRDLFLLCFSSNCCLKRACSAFRLRTASCRAALPFTFANSRLTRLLSRKNFAAFDFASFLSLRRSTLSSLNFRCNAALLFLSCSISSFNFSTFCSA